MAEPDEGTVEALAARILGLPPAPLRLRIAVAGPPGAGKSTLARALVDRLNRDAARAALVPMDGFHLDNAVLDARGLRARKGAPETFDGLGVLRMIERLGQDPEVVIPGFDRARDIAIAGAAVVEPGHRIAVVEGNYLLLDDDPWRRLHPLWDLSVMLSPPVDVLRQRLIDRWLAYGHDPAAAEARALGNDIPNALRVVEGSLPADLVLRD
ncbi:nucleoside/nucleotide kinase family protein [Palleronia sp. KMU-117]|uniref:nucleoside/nucleotide kinase family protein n=1 Tax=Palleronia sp. KMU-117 TaxID=3434108 RepID=UPI003D75378D